MYLPAHFKEQRPEAVAQCMHDHPFATLVIGTGDGPLANHLPMLFDAAANKLVGHVARANPLWQAYAPGTSALAIFSGAQGYVSPSWYPSKRESGKVVPTWNYVVVHVQGTLEFIHDAAWLRAFVGRLTQRFEGGREAPWSVDDAPADFIGQMTRAIVGVELHIAKMEGKFKLSQNRSRPDREGTIEGLERDGATELASLMRSLGEP
jgi:transcriptional regulator